MKSVYKYFQNHDWKLTVLTLVLSVIGILTVYSNTFKSTTIDTGKDAFDKQLVFFFVGIILYFAFSQFDYNWLKFKSIWIGIYIFGLTLLIYVLFFTGQIANVHRWISFGIFQIQPAEVAKLISVVVIASLFSEVWDKTIPIIHEEFNEHKKENKVIKFFKRNLSVIIRIIISYILLGIYAILIFLQPSAGNSVLLIICILLLGILSLPKQGLIGSCVATILITSNIFFGVIKLDILYTLLNFKPLFIGDVDLLVIIISIATILVINIINRTKWYFILVALVIGISIFPITKTLWESNILKDYQKTRITSYFNPEVAISENKDALFQVNRAISAVGSGKLTGKGFLQGLDKVPFEYTDFAFTGYAEEFGFIGVIFLLTLFFLLFIRIYEISRNAENSFAKIFCLGIGIMLLIHSWASISTNLGLIVNTGVPLPFLSYGGTTLVINLVGLGIVQSASNRAKKVDLQSKVVLTSKSPWRRA